MKEILQNPQSYKNGYIDGNLDNWKNDTSYGRKGDRWIYNNYQNFFHKLEYAKDHKGNIIYNTNPKGDNMHIGTDDGKYAEKDFYERRKDIYGRDKTCVYDKFETANNNRQISQIGLGDHNYKNSKFNAQDPVLRNKMASLQASRNYGNRFSQIRAEPIMKPGVPVLENLEGANL